MTVFRSQKNASSPLLRLPQEIKNHIYKLVLGDNFLHISARIGEDEMSTGSCNGICRAEVLDADAEENFHRGGSSDWYIQGGADRNDGCSNKAWSGEQRGLDISLLLVCSQVYSEAQYVVYSSNTFSFERPVFIRVFLHRLKIANPEHLLALRSLHIHIFWQQDGDEHDCIMAIRPISRYL